MRRRWFLLGGRVPDCHPTAALSELALMIRGWVCLEGAELKRPWFSATGESTAYPASNRGGGTPPGPATGHEFGEHLARWQDPAPALSA